MAVASLIEAGLSDLGPGIQSPTASWGNMRQYAQNYIYRATRFVVVRTID